MDWEKEPNGKEVEITHAQVRVAIERRHRVRALRRPSAAKEGAECLLPVMIVSHHFLLQSEHLNQ